MQENKKTAFDQKENKKYRKERSEKKKRRRAENEKEKKRPENWADELPYIHKWFSRDCAN